MLVYLHGTWSIGIFWVLQTPTLLFSAPRTNVMFETNPWIRRKAVAFVSIWLGFPARRWAPERGGFLWWIFVWGGSKCCMYYIPWRIHVCMVYLPTWMVEFYGFHVEVNIPWLHGLYGCDIGGAIRWATRLDSGTPEVLKITVRVAACPMKFEKRLLRLTWPSRLNGFNFLGWRIFSRENKPFKLFFFRVQDG